MGKPSKRKFLDWCRLTRLHFALFVLQFQVVFSSVILFRRKTKLQEASNSILDSKQQPLVKFVGKEDCK